MFFVSAYTAVPAAFVLFELGKYGNPLQIAIFGGLDAMLGDYLIFRFVRDQLYDELRPHFRWFRWFNSRRKQRSVLLKILMPAIGALIIISPSSPTQLPNLPKTINTYCKTINNVLNYPQAPENNQGPSMKRGSTFFLKGVVLLIGIIVLGLCAFWLPGIAGQDAAAHPETASLQFPLLFGAYAAAVPFFIALYQALRLLSYIDHNQAFSELSVAALRNIKFCALAISVLIAGGIVSVTVFVKGDVAVVLSLALILALASSVIATFAAVLQKLFQNAVDIKAENDLTV